MRGLSAVQCAGPQRIWLRYGERTLQSDPAPRNFQASRLATLADDSLTSILSLILDKVSLFFTLTPDSDFERRRVSETSATVSTSQILRSAG